MATTGTGEAAPGGPTDAPQAGAELSAQDKAMLKALGIDLKSVETAKDAMDLADAMYKGTMDASALSKLFKLIGKGARTETAQGIMEWGLMLQAKSLSKNDVYMQARDSWIALTADEQKRILLEAISWKGRAKGAMLQSTAMTPVRSAIQMKNWFKAKASKHTGMVDMSHDDLMLSQVLKAVALGVYPCKEGVLAEVLLAYKAQQETLKKGAGVAEKGALVGQPEIALVGGAASMLLEVDGAAQPVYERVRARMAEEMEVGDEMRDKHDRELGVLGNPIEAAEA